MPELRYEVRPVGIRYMCDSCRSGMMESCDGSILLSSPPKFLHRCTACGAEKHFTTKYPFVKFEAVP